MEYLLDEIGHLRPRIESGYYQTIINRYSTARSQNTLRTFAFKWQPYAWAAIMGFTNNRRRKLEGGTDSFGEFGIIKGRDGSPTVYKSLLMLVIAKEENWKKYLLEPGEYLKVIDEYANGGFDLISEMLEVKGEKYFDEFENFLREIESRQL